VTALLRAVRLLLSALLAPWTLHRHTGNVAPARLAWIAGAAILAAAAMSTTLSSWTYMAGKAVLLPSQNEMDLGHDDLPPDSVVQVAAGFAGSFLVWAILLVLVLVVSAAVADAVYGADRDGVATAMRGAAVLGVWFVVWAAAVFAANAVYEDEMRHPAAAVRAYAQLNQQGFRGSSVMAPGPVEREPFGAPGRFAPLVVFFPLVWSVGLPVARRREGAVARLKTIAAATALSWLAWWAVWRLLPWIRISALAG
jgi:hypothetical protein